MRARLNLLVALTLAPVLVLVIFWTMHEVQTEEAQIHGIVASEAGYLRSRLDEHYLDLQVILNSVVVLAGSRPEAVTPAQLASLMPPQKGSVVNIALFDREGRLLAAHRDPTGRLKQEGDGNMPYLRSPREIDGMVTSSPIVSRANGRTVVIAARRITDEGGNVLGVAALATDVGQLEESLASQVRIAGATAQLIMGEPATDASAMRTQWPRQGLPTAPDQWLVVDQPDQWGGDGRVSVALRASSAPWILVLNASKENLAGEHTAHANSFVVVGLLALIVGLLAAARLMRQHALEVGSLRRLVDRFTPGQPGSGEPLNLTGELGELEVAFSRLQQRLAGQRAELEQEREFYRKLSHSAVDWTWEQDSEFRFTRLTNIGPDFYLGDPRKVIGTCRWEHEYLNMSPAQWEDHRALLRAHQPFRNLVLQARDLNGELRSTRISGDPVFDEKGRFTGYRGTGVDITQAFEVNRAVEQAERRWLAALEGAGHGVWDWDLRTQRVFRSRAWLAMFGLPPDTRADDPALWDELIHPDDRALSMGAFRAHVRGESEQYLSEYRMRHADGSYRWVLDRGRALELLPDGTAARVVGTQTDITALKELQNQLAHSEARRQEIFRKAAVPACLLDAATRQLLDVNDAFCEHFGWRREEAIGRTPPELSLWPELDERARMEDELRRNGRVRNLEVRLRARGGKAQDFLLNVDELDFDGRLAYLSQATNVTDTVASRHALELADRWSRMLINAIPNRFLVTRIEDGVILEINDAACQELGVQRADALGKTTLDLGLWDQPSDRERARQRLLSSGRLEGFVTQRKGRDGKLHHELLYADIVEHNGERFILSQTADITELAETQEALRESEARLQTIFRHSPLPMLIFDQASGHMLAVNEAAQALLQREESALVGTRLLDHGLWADLAEREALYRVLGETGKIRGLELTLALHDGSRADMQIFVDRIQIGGREAFVAQALDVTQARKAREALEQANRWSKILLQSSPTSMMLTRVSDGEIVDVNRQATIELGYPREELVGRKVSEIGHWVDEDERLRLRKALNQQGSVRGMPVMQRTREGELRHVLAFAEHVELDNEQFILSHAVDVTEMVRMQEALNASEHRLRAILERSPNVAIQGFDVAGRVRLWNASSERLFGWTPQEAWGQSLDQLICDPEAARQFADGLTALESSGGVWGPFESEAHARDGRPLTLLSTLFEVPEAEDGIRFICMDVDITERKQHERKLRESEASLETLLQQSALPMVVLDGETLKVSRTNAALERIFGLSAQSLLGNRLADFNIWDDPDQRLELLRKLEEAGHVHGMQVRMTAPGGRPVELLVFVDKLQLGGRTMLIAQGLDITAERRARREQQNATQLARIVLENSPAVLILTREEDRIISEVNDVACRFYGFTREEMIGQSAQALNVWVDPEERAEAAGHFEKTGELTAFPISMRIKSGEVRRCLLYWRRVTWQDTPHILGQAVDITELSRIQQELSESDRRMQSVFEHSPVPMVIVAGEPSRIAQINPALSDLLGLDPQEVAGRPVDALGLWGEALQADPRTNVEPEAGFPAGLSRRQARAREFRVRSRDGAMRDFLIFVERIPYGGGHALIGQGIDVTDGRRAMREAERSRRWFRALFERSPIAMTLIRASDGRTVMANEANQRTYGVSAQELIGRTSIEAGTWQDPDDARHVLEQLHRDGFVRGVVTRRRRQDGTLLEVMVYAEPLHLDDEQYYMTQGIDVTEAQAAQRALRAVTALNSAAFNAVGEAIVVHGADGRVVLVNSAAENMFGQPAAALAGQTLGSVAFTWIRLDEQPLADSELPFVEVRASGTPVHERVIGLLRSRPRWYSVSCEPIDADGDGVSEGTVTSFFDITDRVMAEAELRVLLDRLQLQLERMPIPCFLTDADHQVLYWNPAAHSLFGYAADEMLGESIDRLTPEPLRTGVRAQIAKAFESRSGIDFGTENLTRAGRRLICEWRSNVLHGADGGFVAIMHMAIDMTEIIESQKRLARDNEELESRVAQRTAELSATVRELELFSYTVAHDLRAPLRALDGYSYLLAEGGADAPEMLARIRSNVAHMSALIDGLLHYGRMGRQALNWHRVDMNSLVAGVVQDLGQTYPAVVFESARLPDAPGDESMIRQVWTNLIGNACKFSAKSATPRVSIGAEVNATGGRRYWVRDNGVGFDMAHASRLFGVFERLHKQHEFSGSGVGLSIVKRIVERHGGSVGVESRLGEGALFWFELPAEGPDAAP